MKKKRLLVESKYSQYLFENGYSIEKQIDYGNSLKHTMYVKDNDCILIVSVGDFILNIHKKNKQESFWNRVKVSLRTKFWMQFTITL